MSAYILLGEKISSCCIHLLAFGILLVSLAPWTLILTVIFAKEDQIRIQSHLFLKVHSTFEFSTAIWVHEPNWTADCQVLNNHNAHIHLIHPLPGGHTYVRTSNCAVNSQCVILLNGWHIFVFQSKFSSMHFFTMVKLRHHTSIIAAFSPAKAKNDAGYKIFLYILWRNGNWFFYEAFHKF